MKKKISLLLKFLFNSILNPTFSWAPNEGITSLRGKMNFYFFLHRTLRKKYQSELQFFGKKTKKDYIYTIIFPYPFIETLSRKDIPVSFDIDNGLFFAVHEGKRLYLKQEIDTEEKAQNAYYCAYIEQHKESPHCYLKEHFNLEGGVMLDVGAAESLLGLMYIEKIDKLYIFESQKEWIKALQLTFEPWKDKVVIVNKYVSDNNGGDCITLDAIVKDEAVELLKIDVEGAEKKILDGASETLKKTKKLCICTYHKNKDEIVLKEFLEKRGWTTSFSDNYILYIYSKLYPPYFRKCLIRAVKK